MSDHVAHMTLAGLAMYVKPHMLIRKPKEGTSKPHVIFDLHSLRCLRTHRHTQYYRCSEILWRDTGGRGRQEMIQCGKKNAPKQNASRSCFEFYLISLVKWRGGGGGRGGWRDKKGVCVWRLCCGLASFQLDDGLMAELRVEREAADSLQIRQLCTVQCTQLFALGLKTEKMKHQLINRK